MPSSNYVNFAMIAAFAALANPIDALAQSAKPGDVTASTSVTAVYTVDTDLDGGGNFNWGTGIVSGTITRQVTPQWSVGLTLRYDYENWKFGNPVAFGGQSPWGKLNAPNIAFNFGYAITPDMSIGVTPTFGWGYETGSSESGLIYGAIVSATRVFSPSLVLGIGAGVIRQIDETKVFPFLIVNWQIDDKWRLANPFRAGPSGGAGLELTYSIDDNWEAAAGAAYRSYRFQLRDDSAVAPSGVGENRFIPVFARVTRKFGRQTQLDFYAGVSVSGRLSVDNSGGNSVAQDDYKTAPSLGLTLAHRY